MPVHIKKRNMIAQVFLTIITIGIYTIYWFYQVSVELKGIANDENANPALWTVLLFVPFASIYSIYKFSELYEKMVVICSLLGFLTGSLVYRSNGAKQESRYSVPRTGKKY